MTAAQSKSDDRAKDSKKKTKKVYGDRSLSLVETSIVNGRLHFVESTWFPALFHILSQFNNQKPFRKLQKQPFLQYIILYVLPKNKNNLSPEQQYLYLDECSGTDFDGVLKKPFGENFTTNEN